jgi:nucleoside-diphosphate-sugar epimerase
MTEKRILIVGATGAIGRPLSARLRAAGFVVFGIHRSPQGATTLRALGCEPLAPNVFDEAEVRTAIETSRPDVVIHQLTALPKEINPRALAQAARVTAALRRQTVPLFARLSERAGARLIAQSMSFVTTPEGPAILDETAPLWLDGPRDIANTNEAIRVLEQATLQVQGCALRYGFFYGPGTWYAGGSALADMVRKRMMPVAGKGEGLASFIHIDDAVDATVRAVERERSGVYNICDDHPAPQQEWLPELARLLKAKPPRHAPAWLVGLFGGATAKFYGTTLRGASNAKAKSELGIRPRTWREGFAAEFGLGPAPERRHRAPALLRAVQLAATQFPRI